MRRRERAEAEVSHARLASREDPDVRREEVALEADGRGRAARRVDGAVPAAHEDGRAARVVVVLVRQEERRDRLGRDTARLHPPLDLARGEAGVDQHPRPRPPRRHTRCRRSRTRGPMTRTAKMYQQSRQTMSEGERRVSRPGCRSRRSCARPSSPASDRRAALARFGARGAPGAITSCAMRSPRASVTGSAPRLARMTPISPAVVAVDRARGRSAASGRGEIARPLRMRTWPSKPSRDRDGDARRNEGARARARASAARGPPRAGRSRPSPASRRRELQALAMREDRQDANVGHRGVCNHRIPVSDFRIHGFVLRRFGKYGPSVSVDEEPGCAALRSRPRCA